MVLLFMENTPLKYSSMRRSGIYADALGWDILFIYHNKPLHTIRFTQAQVVIHSCPRLYTAAGHMAAVHALRRYGRFGLCMVYYMRAEDRAQEKDEMPR